MVGKRAGWLVILFLGEMLTASAMGHFEHEIEKVVMLALFVPLIISSGGNSGSQAATLIIRALAVKELTIRDWWDVMRREIVSGMVLGFVLGSLGFLRVAVWQELNWHNYGVHWILLATTIFFSLIGIVLWGTISGSMIPIILTKSIIYLGRILSSRNFVLLRISLALFTFSGNKVSFSTVCITTIALGEFSKSFFCLFLIFFFFVTGIYSNLINFFN